MSATCPNCRGAVAADAPACPHCKADFGKHSAWKPVVAGAGKAAAAGDPVFLSAMGATTLSVAAWVVVFLGAASASYQQVGGMGMFRWALSRSLAGFGPYLALAALLLGAVAFWLSKGKTVPRVAFVLGAGLWLFARVWTR